MESQKEDGVAREAGAMVAAAAVTSDSSPVQESPFSNYLNNLSPIKPIKAANAGQVFHGINSSPLVFSSPTLNLQSRSDHVKRSKVFESSKLEQSDNARKDDSADSSQKYKDFVTQSGNVLVGLNEEFADAKDSFIPQSHSSSRIMDGFLADPAETDSANSTHLGVHGDCPKSNSSFDCEGGATNGSGEEAIDMLLVSHGLANQEAGNLLICDRPPKESEEHHVAEPSYSVGYVVATNDSPKDDCESQMDIVPDSDIKEGSHLYASSGHEQPLYDSLLNSEANEDHREGASEGLIMLADTHHHEEMQHQRFLLRRCLRFDDVLLDVSSNSLGSPSSNSNSPRSLAVVELEKLNFSGGNATYPKTPVNKLPSAVKPVIRKSSSMTTKRTSGIGLHLNSIIDASPTGAGTCNKLDASTRSAHCVEPHNFTEAEELYVTPLDKRKICLALADAVFIQTSPKRRRKVSNTSVGDGCKRCSCRKSRCLKLYCDCFAAGLFCTEPCACQSCLNRNEEKEAVLAAREQIESRNPLAFAPKIVQSDKGQAATDGENDKWSTPSSARHKKGCNCKRSMCQKKYCECYQAKVGCSDNCRCEGCMNVFGTKGDFLVARDMACRSVDEASLERKRYVKLSMATTYSHAHLMPPTPAFQFADKRKGLLRSGHATKCSSPNSSAKSGSAAGLTREMQFEGSQESPAFVSVTDLLDPNCGEKGHKFYRKHDSLGSLCHPAPRPSPLSTVIFEARNSFSTSYPEGGHLPRSSLCRHRSPDNSRQDHEPWSKIYELLSDDTPGILKDASSPTRRVIVHSPNRKRVSSPHKQISERCSCCSTALRSSSKFILKAVPSFPRLTPSSNSTDNICKSDGQP